MIKWTVRILLGLVLVLAGLFLVFRTPDTDAAAMRAKYGGAPSKFVTIAGGQVVHLRDEGPLNGRADAPVIVLLHGSNSDLHTWQPWVDDLRADFRVIRFDQLGHGLTGPAKDGDYSLKAYVREVDGVANALGLKRFVLAGNSMGGGIAMGYAMAHPERLDGLVLVDAGGARIAARGKGNIGFTIARTPVLNQLMLHITPRSMIEKSLRQTVSNQAVVTPAAVDRYWELLRYPGNRAATLARFQQPFWSFDPAQVQAVKVPTLVMWGEDDPLIPYAAAQWYMANLPNAQLAHFAGIGHLPMEEAPAQTIAALRSWLAGHKSAAGAGN